MIIIDKKLMLKLKEREVKENNAGKSIKEM